MITNEPINWTAITDVLEKVLIPVIIGYITYQISKKQIINAGITQFRQRWIDELREAVTLYIAKAEMIAMLEFGDNEKYSEHFQQLVQMQYQIELMLNPGEEDHNKINIITTNIRNVVHDEHIDNNTLDRLLTHKIDQLLKATKVVLKKEWAVVKKGS